LKAELPPPGDPQTLTVLDLSGYVFRAYHALPPLTSSRGEPTGAVLGVTTMVQKLLAERRPAYLAVAIDAPGSFRKEIYPEYKATRRARPPDLPPQAERVTEIARAYALPCLEAPGFEADDLIATVVRFARSKGLQVVIASADKDLLQLVGDGVVMHDTMRDVVYGVDETIAKLGVRPDQVRDYLALVGDSSDNVPGVPKVGPKTAVELLEKYGTLDAVLAHANEITKPALRATLTDNVASAELSRTLVSLREDAPIALDLDALKPGAPDYVKLRALFRDLELIRPSQELERVAAGQGGTAVPAARVAEPPAPKPPPLPRVTPTIVSDLGALDQALAAANASAAVAFATVLEGDDARRSPIVGVAIGWREGAAYVPLGHVYLGRPDQVSIDAVAQRLAALVHGVHAPLFVHDGKRETIIWHRHGVDLALGAGDVDTMLASYLLHADEHAHALSDVAMTEVGVEIPPLAAMVPKGARGKSGRASEAEAERIGQWGADAVRALIPAGVAQAAALGKDAPLEGVYRELEVPLSRVLVKLEETGVRVDSARLAKSSKAYDARIADLEAKCASIVGHTVQIGSPRALEALLFDELGLPSKKRTKTARSTDADVLEELSELHPLPEVVLAWRQLTKLKSTYLDALPAAIDPKTGRVHTRFNQAVAATGRLSSSEPNLQNIPIRTEEGRLIREAFIPEGGFTIMSADYSQIELRLLAHLSGDPDLSDAYRTHSDVHVRTATAIFGVAPHEVTKDQRAQAKTVNFAVIYGQTETALARNLKIDSKEARRYIQAFFARYAGVARYLDTVVDEARRTGFVRTLFGRKREVVDIDSRNRTERWAAERIARNTPIQGTAADILKRAMIDVDRVLTERQARSRMILTVHDELVLEIHESEIDSIPKLVTHAMENAAKLDVPLVVESGLGPSWGSAH
jgi:DNA polymerase-1